ncbi:MAG: thiamine-phosphate kinase [Planctomycetaceae bacterium]|nr:thiamine-phosphate kinase [Planctomycetaceae bacterium]
MTSERDFLRKLQATFPIRPPVVTGIGDDGAVLRPDENSDQVIVTDMLLDGVHFDLKTTSPSLAGRKAVAVNLSDLAAMGCTPESAFVSIAVPRSVPDYEQFLKSLYQGIQEIASQWNFTIAGGDTNSWDGPFAINVCLTGRPYAESPVLRSTAQVGDVLAVSGPLGGSLCRDRHLTFEPRLRLSEWLCRHWRPSAMMDISDGLAIDLSRMMEASGTGAVLWQDSIPIHADVAASESHADRLQHALSDGEDFELLVALPADVRDCADFRNYWQAAGGQLIGEVTADSGKCILRSSDGMSSRELESTGWQHF